MPPILDWQFLLRAAPGRVAADAGGSVWAIDVPIWITAIATAGLLAGAIVTAIYAVKAFGDQVREVAILAKQNDRETTERRRDQAARVFLTAPHESVYVVSPSAVNASEFPVYDAQIWYEREGVLSEPEDLGMIDPKRSIPARRTFSAAQALTHTILTFRDAAGVCWIRMPDGTIKEREHDTARDSILAALGRPLPVPAEPVAAHEPAGQAEDPGSPGDE